MTGARALARWKPDGVFVTGAGGVRFEPLPPPAQSEVERLLRGERHRVLRLLEKRGALPAQGPRTHQHSFPAGPWAAPRQWASISPIVLISASELADLLHGCGHPGTQALAYHVR
ncbi:uncharacterized protein STAUR_7446 [Stigmatella aurantiaca DW4/3-1]|uniref:Uncharacterized protein n=1 Tax=Stigmatella aurantiaca (strain DW4/3-1) TaxID=378806 RepID=E3FFU3_STIAD|nr:uncharacterized protein STAUR_7446 [Stigmatella aurantiaca DW4/3-1]